LDVNCGSHFSTRPRDFLEPISTVTSARPWLCESPSLFSPESCSPFRPTGFLEVDRQLFIITNIWLTCRRTYWARPSRFSLPIQLRMRDRILESWKKMRGPCVVVLPSECLGTSSVCAAPRPFCNLTKFRLCAVAGFTFVMHLDLAVTLCNYSFLSVCSEGFTREVCHWTPPTLSESAERGSWIE